MRDTEQKSGSMQLLILDPTTEVLGNVTRCNLRTVSKTYQVVSRSTPYMIGPALLHCGEFLSFEVELRIHLIFPFIVL